MRGSILASQIESELKREKYFKQKAIRNKCIVDNKKQCNECKYQEICEDADEH